MIQENVDPSFIIFAYLPKDLADKLDALHQPKDLGKTLSNIRKYANNVCPQVKEQVTYMNLRVGFNVEPAEEVIKDMHAVSGGKAQVFRSPLQAAFTKHISWLLPSYKGQSLKDTEDFVNNAIMQIDSSQVMIPKYPKPQDPNDPLTIALIFKPIFDGTSKKECDKQGIKSEPVFGMHVIMHHSQKALVAILIDYILSSPSFMSANKLNTLMIPVYNGSGSLSEAMKLKKAISHQRYFQSNIYSAPVQGLLSLDIPNSKQLTAHSYIMAIKCNNTRVFLFMDANPSWDGYAINVSFSKTFDKEAWFKAENLAAYAYHDLGDPSLEFFSEDLSPKVL